MKVNSGVGGGATVSPTQPAPAPRSSKERLHYIQAMRAIAIVIVVVTHCTALLPMGDVVRSPGVHFFFRHINIVFIFVSGFLFQYLIASFHYSRYLKTKINNVILPYLIISIPALMIYMLGLKDASQAVPAEVAEHSTILLPYMIFTGTQLGPLWFIPMMALLYLISPLLHAIDSRPRTYFLIIPLLIVALLIGRSPDDSNPFQNAIFYLPVYMIGMAASHFRSGWLGALQKHWLVMMMLIFIPHFVPPTTPGWDGMIFLTKIIFCCGLVGMLSRFTSSVPKWIDAVGNASFGIYFLHGYPVAALTMIAVGRYTQLTGFSGLMLYSAAVLAISMTGVWIVKRITGRWSRRIIGV